MQPADGVRCGGNMRAEAGPTLALPLALSDECLSLVLHLCSSPTWAYVEASVKGERPLPAVAL